MDFDFLIVGAGLAGCVFAERAATVLKKKVLIIDRKPHVAGNSYDYIDKNGIIIHKYGPHIFHTNNKIVWNYLSDFTDWHIYFHKVNAVVDGIEVPLPFNLNSIYKVFPNSLATRLEEKLIENFGFNTKVSILNLKKTDDKDLKFLYEYVYKKVFLEYTLKQWGVTPEDLDEKVTARIPVYISRDDRYFQDKYQGIPSNGYTVMVEKMLEHKNIKVRLNTEFKELSKEITFKHIVFTGQMDEYFEFSHGQLPYRSLYFDSKEFNTEYYQEKAVTNYPENYDFTRITEYKHFLNTKSSSTTIAVEYPQAFVQGENDPYYPIPNEENSKKYELYSTEAKKHKEVTFIGRLAEYKYYNMDQIVEQALEVFNNKFAVEK
ncbi:MAG: UDP-galactopyranose mutase [bacterium]